MRVVPSQCAVVGKLFVASLTMGVEMQRVAVQMFLLRLCFQHSMQDYYYQKVDFLNALRTVGIPGTYRCRTESRLLIIREVFDHTAKA